MSSPPAGHQAICDRLGPNQIEELYQRWMQVIPIPLDDRNRLAGLAVGVVHGPSNHRL